MPRPQVPEETILKAAAELFGERGYRGTATAAIAQRAGINEVTLFRRFGSKKGVLVALTAQWAQKMAGISVAFATDADDVRGTLAVLARMEFEGADEYGAVAMRMVVDAASTPEIADVMGSNPHENMRGLAAYLAEHQRTGEVRPDLDPWVMAEAFFGMTSTQVIAHRVLRLDNPSELPREEIIRQLVEMFCAAVLTEECGA